MRRCLAGADKSPCLGLAYTRLRLGVNDEQHYRSDQANRLPAIPIRVRIEPAKCQGIIEHQPGGFEAQAVVLLVELIFSAVQVQFTHAPARDCSYINVATVPGKSKPSQAPWHANPRRDGCSRWGGPEGFSRCCPDLYQIPLTKTYVGDSPTRV